MVPAAMVAGVSGAGQHGRGRRESGKPAREAWRSSCLGGGAAFLGSHFREPG